MSAQTRREGPVTRLMESLTPILFSVLGAAGGMMLCISLIGYSVHNDATASAEVKNIFASFPPNSVSLSILILATIIALAIIFTWKEFSKRSA